MPRRCDRNALLGRPSSIGTFSLEKYQTECNMRRDKELLSKQMGLGPVWRLRDTQAGSAVETNLLATVFDMTEGAEKAEFLFIGDVFDQLGAGEDELLHDKKQQLMAQIRLQLERASGQKTHLVHLRKFHHTVGPNDATSQVTEENLACLVHLRAQLRLIQPKVIIVLGASTALDLFALLGETNRTPSMPAELVFEGVPTSIAESLDELLTQPQKKRQLWQMLCQVMCFA
jgi:uracil-DNA glycosylase